MTRWLRRRWPAGTPVLYLEGGAGTLRRGTLQTAFDLRRQDDEFPASTILTADGRLVPGAELRWFPAAEAQAAAAGRRPPPAGPRCHRFGPEPDRELFD